MKRERWSETEVLALPLEESDVFERKGGGLLQDNEQFLKALGKAVSAMANSGGGSILLGVENDGSLTGIGPLRGKENIRDWLEQKIPNLTSYPLSDFRVHTVERSDPSTIPNDKVIIVIDISDSALAPHQNSRDHIYYHRSAGRSIPAPHFYIELLRQRLTNAVLSLSVRSIKFVSVTQVSEGLFAAFNIEFRVENIGNATSYKFQVVEHAVECDDDALEAHHMSKISFNKSEFPAGILKSGSIPFDTAVLPGCVYNVNRDIGFRLSMRDRAGSSLRSALAVLVHGTTIHYRLATETSRGEITAVRLSEFMSVDRLASEIFEKFGDSWI